MSSSPFVSSEASCIKFQDPKEMDPLYGTIIGLAPSPREILVKTYEVLSAQGTLEGKYVPCGSGGD